MELRGEGIAGRSGLTFSRFARVVPHGHAEHGNAHNHRNTHDALEALGLAAQRLDDKRARRCLRVTKADVRASLDRKHLDRVGRAAKVLPLVWLPSASTTN